jgi:hypothetical protein
VDLEAGRTLRIRLRGRAPGTGAPTLRVLRPGGAEVAVAPEVRRSLVLLDLPVDETGEWTLVVGPPAEGRRNWLLVLRDDGPRPRERAMADLRDLVVWRGNVGTLMRFRCASCHSGPFPNGGVRLTSWEGAVAAQDDILFQVESGTMPPNGGLSPSQVDRIRTWIEQGALRR